MLKTAFSKIKKALRRSLKKAKKICRRKPKTFLAIFVITSLILVSLGVYICLKPKPNDDIFFLPTNSNAVLGSKNPSFNVEFGKRDQPDTQWVRFEAKSSSKNPFEEEKENIFTKISDWVKPKKEYGIEMSLKGVNLSETEKLEISDSSDVVKSVAEIIGTDSVSTTTELVESGRVIGEYTEDPVSKKTVLNKEVADGVDIEYQILEGLGLKEEIVIRDLEAYTKDCGDNLLECKLPLNEFIFDIKLDDGLELHQSSMGVGGNPAGTYYFTDSDKNYIAHFLPSFAFDTAGARTTGVELIVEETEEVGLYWVNVSLDIEWLLSPERVFPVHIDPSVVHDSSASFEQGSLNRLEVVTGPKVQLVEQELTADEHTLGLWHMNESSGSTVADSSGNGNTGTATGATIIDGKLGKSRSFNGTSDEISIGNVSMVDNLSDLTLEAWVLTNSSDVAHRRLFSENIVLYIGQTMDNMSVYMGDGSAWTHTATDMGFVSTGEWHHVAFVKDGTNAYIYIDGELTGTTSAPATLGSTSYVNYIGSRGASLQVWDGSIDEFRISNIARTPEEIKASAQKRPYGTYISESIDLTANVTAIDDLQWTETGVSTGDGETPYSTTGLVGQWNFNETSGTTATNEGSCGASCDGTLVNMTTTGQDDGIGTGWTGVNSKWGGGALMFDGSNDYVEISDNTVFTLDNDFTLSAWIKLNKVPTDVSPTYRMSIISHRDGTNSWEFTVSTSNANVCLYKEGVGQISSNTHLEPHKWYYVVVVYDDTNDEVSLYINGSLDKIESKNIDYNDSANPVVIGKTAHTSLYYFDGAIDSVNIYSRALPSSEILSNYNSTDIEFLTRTSADGSTWEEWKPSTGETQIDSMDTDEDNTFVYSWAQETRDTDLTWIKKDNSIPSASDTTSTNGRIPIGLSGGDDTSVGEPTVIKDGDIYKMWYSGTNSGYTSSIFYATSPDGLTWTKYDNSTPSASDTTSTNGRIAVGTSGKGDESSVLSPSVIKDGDTYKMWYIGQDSGWSSRVYYATSPDGLTWTKYDNSIPSASDTTSTNGRVPLGLSGGDTLLIMDTTIIKDGDTYKMWYSGIYNFMLFIHEIYYATSPDGLTWTKYDNSIPSASDTTSTNGRIPVGTSGKGDVASTHSPSVIKDGDTYKMWYVGQDSGGISSVYYATSFDGLTWTKYDNSTPSASNTTSTNGRIPVGTSGKGDIGGALSPLVIKDGYYYKVWYVGSSNYVTYILHAATTPINLNQETDKNILLEGDGSMRVSMGSTQPDNATVGLWHLDETGGTGAYIKDYSGNDNHGTPTGTTYTNGKVGGARSFNGSSDNVTLGTLGSLGSSLGGSAISFSFWIKTTYTDAIRQFGTLNDGSNTILVINFNRDQSDSYSAGKIGLDIRQNGGGNLRGSTDVSEMYDGEWHHVYISGKASSNFIEIYLDGIRKTVAYGAQNTPSSFSNFQYPFAVGATNSRGAIASHLPCSLDEFFISTKELTSEEIYESYRMGRDQYITNTIDSQNISSSTRIEYDIAADRPGSYISSVIGESNYANYLPDENTLGLWHLEEETGTGAYLGDSSGNGNDGTPDFSNQALSKTSSLSTTNASYPASYCNDGNTGNFCHSSTTNGEWWKVDIGSLMLIDTIVVWNRADCCQTRANGFTLEVSETGSFSGEQEVVYQAGSSEAPGRPSTYNITPTLGRYVRFRIPSGADRWLNIAEILVYSRPIHSEGKVGGGIYLNRTDYIKTTSTTPWNFGTGEFSEDFWINFSATTDNQYITDIGSNGSVVRWYSGAWRVENPAGTVILSYAHTPTVNMWYHFAVTRGSGVMKLYLNGEVVASGASTGSFGSNAVLTIGNYGGTGPYGVVGRLDEVRISNVARTPTEIRQAYEIGRRTHPITIDFGASLNSGNLITGSTDKTFTIDATTVGLSEMGSGLYYNDKVIVKENYNGTEYIAQGDVIAINKTTGAVEVDSWDTGSTFPSGGYTVNATVFKWQREYMDISNIRNDDIDAISNISFRITNGNEGRNIWIDDIKHSGYLSDPAGTSNVTSTPNRYLQYMAVLSTKDGNVTPYFSNMTLNYIATTGPTMDQIMRHGKWFGTGEKQNFWWAE